MDSGLVLNDSSQGGKYGGECTVVPATCVHDTLLTAMKQILTLKPVSFRE